MRLTIHSIQVGDILTMVGPDGVESESFTLAEPLGLRSNTLWIYREFDAPVVVERNYGLRSTFHLHSRTAPGRHRA